MEKVWDMLIVGGGPAGLAAGLYGARAGAACLLLEAGTPGGQMLLTEQIGNYPGAGTIEGFVLAEQMLQDAVDAGLSWQRAAVLSARLEGSEKELATDIGPFRARAVILAAGAAPRKLGLPAEARLLGRGVSYCALCDGFFYRGKTVCVVGGGNSAAEEALYLAALAEKVYLIHRRARFTAGQAVLERLRRTENVTILTGCQIKHILGTEHVTGIALEDAQTRQLQLDTDGIFIAIGRCPATDFLPQALSKDENGALRTDENLACSLPGVFAAGDIRRKGTRQVLTAAADGAVAAGSALEYLNKS